jgi:hypothetical protein
VCGKRGFSAPWPGDLQPYARLPHNEPHLLDSQGISPAELVPKTLVFRTLRAAAANRQVGAGDRWDCAGRGARGWRRWGNVSRFFARNDGGPVDLGAGSLRVTPAVDWFIKLLPAGRPVPKAVELKRDTCSRNCADLGLPDRTSLRYPTEEKRRGGQRNRRLIGRATAACREEDRVPA